MEMLVRAALLMSPLLLCHAFLNLTGSNEIKAVWKGPTTLPCVYVPVEDFVQETLTWTVVHDQNSGTIFRRDGSGDHVLLAEYRDRVSVLKDSPGNVSLHILSMEISDRGTYTCQVTWRANNNSLIVKEISTKVEVVKVAVTKPVVRAGELGLVVPAGARTSLTCVASGSPPIRYRWFRGSPGGTAQPLGSQAELAWAHLLPSDAGTYFCQAENRVGAAQRSDTVQLVVTEKNQTDLVFEGTSWTPGGSTTITDLPVTAVTPESGVGYPEKNYTTQNSQRTPLSLISVILIALACSAVVFLVIFLIVCIRKPKDAQTYEVKFHNLKGAASSRCESTGHYEEPISCTDSNYVVEPMKNKGAEEINTQKNEYECVGNTQESEYEVGDTA
ncbi:V-set and immunoglobulin domain-containing protein 4-like isoform X2 [Apus apus]|uniref:V-set and immunoglobulin domain-containing protein 4-like isoform X2 n=1 Tax=Apus apus TaxID=8895 RepID=UPI0021F8589D|nr:V-set and immunoglobulin domain-containing protein 4-like isoform X2 [Apus apus]